MKIEKINPKINNQDLQQIDSGFIFEAIERYVNSRGISKKSILNKFDALKIRNEEKNKKLLSSLLKYNKKMEEIRKEINNLNSSIEIDIQKIKSSLS